MSFSSEIKEELSRQIPAARHCRLAEAAAILGFGSHVTEGAEGPHSVKMHTENLAVARKYFTLLRKTFNIDMNVSVKQNQSFRGSKSYDITSYADLSAVKHTLVQNLCCKRAYIRGAFLASGSISDPEKGYHFEIVCNTETEAERLQQLIGSFAIEARITQRKTILFYILRKVPRSRIY